MNPVLRLGRHFNALISTGITSVYIYFKISNTEKCQQMLKEKKDDSTLILPPRLKNLVNEVMDDMKVKEEVKTRIQFFLSENSEFQHHGSIKQSAFLGIPQYFLIDPNTSVNITAMVKKQFTDVSDPQLLSNALHLSKEAKKFAIAHELNEVLHQIESILILLPLALNLNCIFLSYLVEKVSKTLKKKPVYLDHILLFFLGAILYFLSFDAMMLYTEANADFLASDLGKSYIKGGIEYYEKMIEKNKEIKKIDKNAPYSAEGDIKFSLFGKYHMPLQNRIVYLKDLLNDKDKPFIWKYVLFAH